MSVLVDLATHLQTQGVGTIGTDLFHGRRPTTPDTCLTLQTYSGGPNRIHGDTNIPADERYAVQVMARAPRLSDAETLAASAFASIAFRYETLGGRHYSWCRASSMPASLGTDANDRHLVGFNVTLRRDNTVGL